MQVRAFPQQINVYSESIRASRRFKYFYIALPLAFLGISISVVYRMAVMSQGWGMGFMKNEPAFICLNGV